MAFFMGVGRYLLAGWLIFVLGGPFYALGFWARYLA